MIFSLTVAATFDSVAYVMVSSTDSFVCERGMFREKLFKLMYVGEREIFPPFLITLFHRTCCFLLNLQGESHSEGSVCNFQAWWLTYFGKFGN